MQDFDIRADLYRDHVARLSTAYSEALMESGWDAVVIHSGSAQKRSQFDDQYWALRPVPHFHHWLPLAEADCALVIQPGSRPLLLRVTANDFWEAPRPFEAEFVWECLEVQGIAEAKSIATHLPAGKIAFIGEDRARAASWGLSETAIFGAGDESGSFSPERSSSLMRALTSQSALP